MSTSVNAFVEKTFEAVGLGRHDHVETDTGLFRPTDIAVSRVSPEKMYRELGWRPSYRVTDIVRGMMEMKSASVHSC